MNTLRRKWLRYFAVLLMGSVAVWGVYTVTRPPDVVVVRLGEPYEKVRLQSRSTLPVATDENSIDLRVARPASLRFSDPEHGFVTPVARFLSIYTSQHGDVSIVTLSPQTQTLPLAEAMAIALDLQQQLGRRGWHPIRSSGFAPISNTPAMVERIRRGDDPHSVWQVAGKYQVTLDIRRFVHENRPVDERYLVTLELSGPPLTEIQPEK
jgi:hypothetical protein